MQLNSSTAKVIHIDRDIDVSDLESSVWEKAPPVEVGRYWSGKPAPESRHFKAQLLWSDAAIYVRFTARQREPVFVSERPDRTRKSIGMWDRDVCEIFIAPDDKTPNRYFEFEVAPNGEWVDLAIEVLPEKRLTDWNFSSGMRSAARVEKDQVVMAIRVEWKALGKTPKPGDKWLGNLFRCVGKDPNRGYLAWQPTLTKEPAFHVPTKFGEFVFVK